MKASKQIAALNSDRVALQTSNQTLQGQIDSLTEQLREANARRPLMKLTGMTQDQVTSLVNGKPVRSLTPVEPPLTVTVYVVELVRADDGVSVAVLVAAL